MYTSLLIETVISEEVRAAAADAAEKAAQINKSNDGSNRSVASSTRSSNATGNARRATSFGIPAASFYINDDEDLDLHGSARNF